MSRRARAADDWQTIGTYAGPNHSPVCHLATDPVKVAINSVSNKLAQMTVETEENELRSNALWLKRRSDSAKEIQTEPGVESFGSVAELKDHIDTFIISYNEDVRPFVWTKSFAHQNKPESCFAV
jgi:hypothetical protein